jgi:hypothetical protein
MFENQSIEISAQSVSMPINAFSNTLDAASNSIFSTGSLIPRSNVA